MITIADKIVGEIIHDIQVDFTTRLRVGEMAASGIVDCPEAPTILSNIVASGAKLLFSVEVPSIAGLYKATLTCIGDGTPPSERKVTIAIKAVEEQ